MKKNYFVCLFLLLSCLSAITAQDWYLEYKTPDSYESENWIKAFFIIYNDSRTPVPMSELAIRYWYTSDGQENDVFDCWWAQVGRGNVTGSFVDIVPALPGADRYCEIGFTSNAGILQSGTSSGEIQGVWHKSNWELYDETDDYSQDHTITSYIPWDKAGLYHNGILVWGIEPDTGGEPPPENTPEVTPEITPDMTPEVTPDITPYITPEITPETTPEVTPEITPGVTPEITPEITPENTPAPGTGEGIRIEAEDYNNYQDTTSGNEGGMYRSDDVDIEQCAEGGYDVGWIAQGEWLDYTFTVSTADTFTIYIRIGSPHAYDQGLYIEIDGEDVSGWLSIPDTGAWQGWQDISVDNVSINAGTHTLRLMLNADFTINFIYLESSTNPPTPTEPPGAFPTSTPPPGYTSVVSRYGQLQIIGSSLCDEIGNPVTLKGISTHGLQWYPIMKGHTIPNLVYDWNVQVIRPAMYIEETKDGSYWGGYMVHPDYMKARLTDYIDDALDTGIYILVDWHIHNDPTNFTPEAIDFFQEMATAYGGYPNIIYEICNEPEYVSWDTIKTYANAVIPVIRGIDPDNIILVGTPNWCQDLDVAADSPLTGYTNIMYSLHFYAGTHYQSIRDKADYALQNGLPLFVSEWGTSDSTGGTSGVNYFPDSDIWVDWMNQHHLSWINWNFSYKSESSAALLPGVNIGGPWEESELSDSGRYIKPLIMSDDPLPEPTPEGTPVPPPECTSGTPISPDFVQDGAGNYCWEAESLGSYINSWNLDVLEINGLDFTNQWAGTEDLPPKIDGKYYISYHCSVSWGHFEAMN
jgi:hypothetical protein